MKQNKLKESLVTCSELKLILNYDPETGIWTWLKSNHSRKCGDRAGYNRPHAKGKIYEVIGIRGNIYKSSRLAFLYMTGEWPNNYIDHINGDSLDNRWCNLRECSHVENMQNIIHKNKKSGLPLGVSSSGNRYGAIIRIDGKSLVIGYYDTVEEASREYINARRKYFGEYNRL